MSTPRTLALLEAGCTNKELAEHAFQLEEELAAERELRIMQLAAISTATLQNTDRAIKDRIGTDNPYCSTAYLDTCAAVDREIRHREELHTLRVSILKLADEWDNPGTVIVNGPQFAMELRKILASNDSKS